MANAASSWVGVSPATCRWAEMGERIEVDGRGVFVRQEGSGPTVFLLHGFPTSSYDWLGVSKRLAEKHRVVTLDFWGYGLSDKPVAFGYSLFDQANLVERVAQRLGIDRASIVSHDMGTSVHCELLARRDEGRLPLAIDRSIFLNGSMLQWMARITPIQELLSANQTLPQAIDLCRTSVEAMYVVGLQGLMAVPEAIGEEEAAVMLELLSYQNGAERLPALAGYMRERYVHADRWLGALSACNTPLSFVWADSDPIVHVDMGREHARQAPQARYRELSGLGHFLMIEDPQRVASAIDEELSFS